MRKLKKQTPKQIAARTRNFNKGSVARAKGMVFWLLRSPQREQFTQTERNRLGTCLFELERILKKWQPTI